MTTIFVLNAVSSFLAVAGIGGFLAWGKRQARRNADLKPLYVTTGTTRPMPRR